MPPTSCELQLPFFKIKYPSIYRMWTGTLSSAPWCGGNYSVSRWIAPVEISWDALTLLIIGFSLWRCQSWLAGWSVALWCILPCYNHAASHYWFSKSGVNHNSNTSIIMHAYIGKKLAGVIHFLLLFHCQGRAMFTMLLNLYGETTPIITRSPL